jgi:hypothetical protein
MKLFIINLVLVALAFAAPVRKQEKRQLIEKEFSNGPCREIILFFVRGTIEPENMVEKHCSSHMSMEANVPIRASSSGHFYPMDSSLPSVLRA